MQHVWDWFWLLSARRQTGADGVNPISYEQIISWSTLTRTIITPSEVELLIWMDDAFLGQVSEEKKGKRERDDDESKRKAKTKPKRR